MFHLSLYQPSFSAEIAHNIRCIISADQRWSLESDPWNHQKNIQISLLNQHCVKKLLVLLKCYSIMIRSFPLDFWQKYFFERVIMQAFCNYAFFAFLTFNKCFKKKKSLKIFALIAWRSARKSLTKLFIKLPYITVFDTFSISIKVSQNASFLSTL